MHKESFDFTKIKVWEANLLAVRREILNTRFWGVILDLVWVLHRENKLKFSN